MEPVPKEIFSALLHWMKVYDDQLYTCSGIIMSESSSVQTSTKTEHRCFYYRYLVEIVAGLWDPIILQSLHHLSIRLTGNRCSNTKH
jgi:hypothetical protein